MALRSLGSNLLAKASPGSSLRETEEQRKQGAVPEQNAGAQPTSVVRETLDQPIEKSVPGGTEKVIASKPAIQPNVSSAPDTGQGLMPQMGGAAQAAATGRNINSQGGNAPGAAVTAPKSSPTSFKAASSVSSTTPVQAKVASYGSNVGMFGPGAIGVGSKNEPSLGTQLPAFSGLGSVGNRASAADGSGGGNTRNIFQGAAATLANAIDKGVVSAVKNKGTTSNYTPTSNVSKALMSYANSPSAAKAGVSSALRSVDNYLHNDYGRGGASIQSTAQNVSKAVQSAVNKVSSVLRSLFK